MLRRAYADRAKGHYVDIAQEPLGGKFWGSGGPYMRKKHAFRTGGRLTHLCNMIFANSTTLFSTYERASGELCQVYSLSPRFGASKRRISFRTTSLNSTGAFRET